MGIPTNNIPNQTGFVQKGLQPGNAKCAIRSIKLEKQAFVTERDEYMLVIQLETEPIPNFKGFDIVFGDPSKGQYKGQTGRIKASSFNYYDGKNSFGYDVSVQDSVLGFLKELCTELGCIDWLNKQNKKHDTIAQLVEAFNNEKPFENIFINYCIGGREYLNKKGYPQYDLNLVRGVDKLKGFSGDATLVVKFDANKHVRKQKPKESNTPHTDAINADANQQEGVLHGNRAHVTNSTPAPEATAGDDLPFSID